MHGLKAIHTIADVATVLKNYGRLSAFFISLNIEHRIFFAGGLPYPRIDTNESLYSVTAGFRVYAAD